LKIYFPMYYSHPVEMWVFLLNAAHIYIYRLNISMTKAAKYSTITPKSAMYISDMVRLLPSLANNSLPQMASGLFGGVPYPPIKPTKERPGFFLRARSKSFFAESFML